MIVQLSIGFFDGLSARFLSQDKTTEGLKLSLGDTDVMAQNRRIGQQIPYSTQKDRLKDKSATDSITKAVFRAPKLKDLPEFTTDFGPFISIESSFPVCSRHHSASLGERAYPTRGSVRRGVLVEFRRMGPTNRRSELMLQHFYASKTQIQRSRCDKATIPIQRQRLHALTHAF